MTPLTTDQPIVTTAPAVVKRVGEYDPITKDYAAYVSIDGGPEEYIGSRKTQGAADRLCDEYAYNFYADHHTPERAAQIAIALSEVELAAVVEGPEPAPPVIDRDRIAANLGLPSPTPEPARRRVSVGWDLKFHPDLATIAAQVLAPLAHLNPALSAKGDYLLIGTRDDIAPPTDDHTIVCDLIDALNEVAVQLPARPDSITAALHVGDELYQVMHNGPPRDAARVNWSEAPPVADDLSPVLAELLLTDAPAAIELLRGHTDKQRQQLAWRYAAWLKRHHGIVREPSFVLRGWSVLIVGAGASGAPTCGCN